MIKVLSIMSTDIQEEKPTTTYTRLVLEDSPNEDDCSNCRSDNEYFKSDSDSPTTVVDEPTVDEPTVDEPTVDEPTVDEPTVDEPTVDEPTVDEPTVEDETLNVNSQHNDYTSDSEDSDDYLEQMYLVSIDKKPKFVFNSKNKAMRFMEIKALEIADNCYNEDDSFQSVFVNENVQNDGYVVSVHCKFMIMQYERILHTLRVSTVRKVEV
jgi:hypothetical protein